MFWFEHLLLLSRQAVWFRGAETRKHNRQREPPVRRAGPRPAGFRHHQLRVQDDEAVKPSRRLGNLPQLPAGAVTGHHGVVCSSASCHFVSSFFISALLACLDFSEEGKFDVGLRKCAVELRQTNVEADGRTGA